MNSHGISIKNASEGKRINIACEHDAGVIYIVPGESSWVCSKENIGAHAISGFFRELANLESTQIEHIMQKWGIYYRGLDSIETKPN